jgi:hypothetical protein
MGRLLVFISIRGSLSSTFSVIARDRLRPMRRPATLGVVQINTDKRNGVDGILTACDCGRWKPLRVSRSLWQMVSGHTGLAVLNGLAEGWHPR